jgi:cobalt-precorrin 5A hydrolase/precorrin-3B C17-methyltransferase
MTTIFFITTRGQKLAHCLAGQFDNVEILQFDSAAVGKRWITGQRLVFIMAVGIVIRTIAPLLRHKRTDPAVVVIDDTGKHVISLLSGHAGGANRLAQDIANALHTTPIITTASDVSGLPALDIWAGEQKLHIANPDALPVVMKRLLDTGCLYAYTDCSIELPAAFLRTDSQRAADIIILPLKQEGSVGTLFLQYPRLAVGIGCNRGTSAQEIESAVRTALQHAHLPFDALAIIATIDMKAEEAGILSFCSRHNVPLVTYTAADLNRVPNVTKSQIVFRATGAHAVAEPAALLAASTDRLLCEKQKLGAVTIAIAQCHRTQSCGSLTLVGTGPGTPDHLTPAAHLALQEADVIVGYETYIDLIRPLISEKPILTTPMTGEVQRCRAAIDLARKGQKVALISGGDPGIYAMAGLVFELLRADGFDTKSFALKVLPGISAVNAAAALLGAPLMHDFCTISLSDRLTPWETIARRIEAAASADFVIAFYNPKSIGRPEHIETAFSIIKQYRPESTPVGIVKAAYRDTQHVQISAIAKVSFDDIDMQTIVIVGNTKTFLWNGRMVTPRGYGDKYDLS